MRKDPIVEEVRKAGDRIARRCGYDLHKFCERMRQVQREFEDRAGMLGTPPGRRRVPASRKPYGKQDAG